MKEIFRGGGGQEEDGLFSAVLAAGPACMCVRAIHVVYVLSR